MLKRFTVLLLGAVLCLGTLGCGGDNTATMPDKVEPPPNEAPTQSSVPAPKPPPRSSTKK